MVEKNKRIHGVWDSHWTYICAAAGSSIGLGVLWKFPYLVGEHGGAEFVLLYLIFTLMLGLPLLLAETTLGRRARQSPVNAIRYLSRESGLGQKWAALGWLGMITGLLIFSYYSVVAGWSVQYLLDTATGTLQAKSVNDHAEHFRLLLDNPSQMMTWQSAFILCTVLVVMRGVHKGLGNAVRWLMPIMLALLLVLINFSYQQGGLDQAARFMFDADWSQLSASTALAALGLACFTLSIGVGSMMAYGAYMPDHPPVARNLFVVALLGLLVAVGFGIVVFSIVSSNPEVDTSTGPGLIFVTLPWAFANMPGGLLWGALFFLMALLAAWSSAISLLEPTVAWLVESTRCNRLLASLLAGLVAWGLGLGTIFSFNRWLGNFNFYGMVDTLTSSLLLPVSALLMAIFVGWRVRPTILREELHTEHHWLYMIWFGLIKFLCPLAIAIILASGIYQLSGEYL